jgi:hypothetical protein
MPTGRLAAQATMCCLVARAMTHSCSHRASATTSSMISRPAKKVGDVIEIDHNIFANFADILANSVQDGSNVVITADAENSITLENVSLTNLNANDFHFV